MSRARRVSAPPSLPNSAPRVSARTGRSRRAVSSSAAPISLSTRANLPELASRPTRARHTCHVLVAPARASARTAGPARRARGLLAHRSMSIRLLMVLPALAGCLSGNVQRSARVPHPGVPLSSGQPLVTSAELSGGLSNVTDMMAPRVGNASQAVEVPGTEMRDELRIRLGQRGTLSLIYEDGFGATSQKPDPTQAPIGDGDVRGYGVSLGYAIPTSTPGLSVGLTFEHMVWSLPYVEYQTCTSEPECPGTNTIIAHGRANPMTFGL